MLIRLTQTITVDGDGDLWGFWGYIDQDAALQSWVAALHQAYATFLHERFPTATVEITLPVVPEAPGLSELTVQLHGTASDPNLLGVDDRTVDALSHGLHSVLEATWTEWQATNPEDGDGAGQL
jgi:hypothetical protein